MRSNRRRIARGLSTGLILFSTLLTAEEQAGFSSIAVKHREHKGIGYEDGYTSLDLFFAATPRNGSIFADLRGHAFNDGTFAANLGLGARLCTGSSIFGVNAFYDFREYPKHVPLNLEPSGSLHRVGGGLEAFFCNFELRANGYVPVGVTKEVTPWEFSHFNGNNAIFDQRGIKALPSVDGEVGYRFCCGSPLELFVGGSPYYLFSRDDQFGGVAGGKGRVSAWIYNMIGVEVSVSYDQIYHTRVQGMLTFSLPLGFFCGAPCEPPAPCIPTCIPRTCRPVYREEIIPLQDRRKTKILIDPETSNPYNFIFTQNNFIGAGNGTFETPYSALSVTEAVSEPGDILYVLFGDDTTMNMDQGITLQNNQKLIGSAADLTLNDYTIPAQTPGLYPSIENATGLSRAITLETNNEVAGLKIINSDVGIFGDNTTKHALHIHDMWIEVADRAVQLTIDNGSTAIIENSFLCGSANTNPAVDLLVSGESSVKIQNNQILNLSGNAGLNIFSNESSFIVENNLLKDTFTYTGFSGNQTLRALGNAGVNPLVDTYIFVNNAGQLQIELPNPSANPATNINKFESLNVGALSIAGDIVFVPLSE